jgi:hypothetical protein
MPRNHKGIVNFGNPEQMVFIGARIARDIVAHVAIACSIGTSGRFELARMDHHRCLLEKGVAAAMVGMQMRADHDIDVIGAKADRLEGRTKGSASSWPSGSTCATCAVMRVSEEKPLSKAASTRARSPHPVKTSPPFTAEANAPAA